MTTPDTITLHLTTAQALDLLEVLDRHPHNEVASIVAARVTAALKREEHAEFARSVRATVRQHIDPDSGERRPA